MRVDGDGHHPPESTEDLIAMGIVCRIIILWAAGRDAANGLTLS